MVCKADTIMPPSDEAVYLLSSPANAKRLKRAKKEIEKGKFTEIENIDDLDKRLYYETKKYHQI